MKIFLYLVKFSLVISAWSAYAIELETDEQKFSYAVGVAFSQSIINQSMQIDNDVFIQAVRDVLEGKTPKLAQEEIQQILNQYRQQIAQQKVEQKAMHSKQNQLDENDFFTKNKAKEGVIELPSGLQYRIINPGSGKRPVVDSKVKVHYQGTLLDGREFDSSYSRGEPAIFSINQVILGWQEILPLMQVGAKWEVYIPSALAYGERGAGDMIGPYAALVFEIELLDIL